MKKISLSLIHIIVAIMTMMICVSKLKSQSYPKAGQHVEMVPTDYQRHMMVLVIWILI